MGNTLWMLNTLNAGTFIAHSPNTPKNFNIRSHAGCAGQGRAGTLRGSGEAPNWKGKEGQASSTPMLGQQTGEKGRAWFTLLFGHQTNEVPATNCMYSLCPALAPYSHLLSQHSSEMFVFCHGTAVPLASLVKRSRKLAFTIDGQASFTSLFGQQNGG